jgi:hypothetical protein
MPAPYEKGPAFFDEVNMSLLGRTFQSDGNVDFLIIEA